MSMTEKELAHLRLEHYYMAAEAAAIISRNSGRKVGTDYLPHLVKYGRLTSVKFSPTLHLYPREEVEKLRVAQRGTSLSKWHMQQGHKTQNPLSRVAV